MVLYLFHVNTGGMLTFEMEMALQTVQNLKETIERLHNIPAASQVLLISGGEVLDLMSRICSYPSGTDENPIYMFTTMFDGQRQFALLPIESHFHYEDEVNRSLSLPAEYNTVVVRAKLAHKMFESATKEIKVCEKLVFEQHLQQQGWAAVMANLEDLTNEFKHRSQDFLNTINDYVEQRLDYLDYLKSFPNDLTKLSSVPILSELLPNAQHDFHGFDEYYLDNVSYTGSTSADSGTSVGGSSSNSRNRESLIQTIDSGSVADSSSQKINLTQLDKTQATKVTDADTVIETPPTRGATLLQWISSRENHKSLRDMADDCSRVLQNFDETAIQKIKSGITRTLEVAEQESVREVRGLTQRLEQLDELMCDAKKMVQEQRELSTAFQQNQVRANNLGDASILPDLCMSHSNHLTVMLQNHNKLLDIEKRIMKAKEELGENLNKRLRYVVHIQNSISDLDSKLLFHHRCFRRLKHHLVIIKQIHEAPSIYMTAVTEVVRRRVFSEALLQWASDLSSHLLNIHEEEKNRRDKFEHAFDEHFLNALFTGLDDNPPAFATKAPSLFDDRLPKLSKSDLKMLAEAIPDFPTDIELSSLTSALNFFSTHHPIDEQKNGSDELKSYTNKLLDIRAKDGCESETDTEEFEKVGQSPIDRRKMVTFLVPTSIEMATSTEAIEMTTTETLTDENAESTQDENNRLKALIISMGQLARNSISLLREQLRVIKDNVDCDKTIEFRKIEEMWTKLKEMNECNERELIQRLTVDHELELNDIRKILSVKTNEMGYLEADNAKLLEKLVNCELDAETSKTRSSDQIDKLKDRISELEEIVKNNDAEKLKAVNEIRDQLTRAHKTDIESLRCRYKLMKNVERTPSDGSLEKCERAELQASSPSSSQSLYRRILDEKEQQLDSANTQIGLLTKENEKFKQMIQSLSDGEAESSLKEQIDVLQKEKVKLRQRLNSERSRRAEMTTSKIDSNPVMSSSHRSRSSGNIYVQFDTCDSNDNVLVIWDQKLYRYVIAQPFSSHHHFMAEDSYLLFNLPVPKTRDVCFDNIDKPSYMLATVVEKQFCLVKRDGSRYRLLNGTKFYRVSVRPLSGHSSKTPKVDMEKVRKELADAQKPNFCRSLSIQLIDSCAQTEVSTQSTSTADQTPGDTDAIDGIHPLHHGVLNEHTKSIYTSEEDVAVIVEPASLNIPLSQEEADPIEMPMAADDCESDEFRSLDTKSDDAGSIS